MCRYIQFLFICVFAGILAQNNVCAQGQHHFFYGKVVDQVSKKPLANVNFSIYGSKEGTTSGMNGEFSFFIDSIPASLFVRHLGYITKNILLDETSFSLAIYLSPAATELAEVEIKANVHEAFFKDEHYAVLDYEIDSNMVYLLIFRQYLSRSELICKNLSGDTVATSAPFNFKPEKLFKECLGNLHLLSHDSGFQVFRQELRLKLIHPVNLRKFDDVLKNCIAATRDVLFFQKVTDHGMGIEYFGVNRKTLVNNSITQIFDEKKMKMLRRNSRDAQLLGNPNHPDSREDFVTWNYVHKILYRPIKTSLYRIGDYICIFNTPEQQIEFYDASGVFSYKLALKIDKVNDGRWTHDVMIDDITGKVYTVFVQNGTYGVYEININNGMLKKQISLFHLYPRKVRIYNNWVYYLYDVAGDPDNKMLFRQKL